MRTTHEVIYCDNCKQDITIRSSDRVELGISMVIKGEGKLTVGGHTREIKGKVDFCNINCMINYCKNK